MEVKWKLHTYTFKPTDYAVSETGETARKIMSVHRGTFIRAAAVRIGVGFDGTTPKIKVGDAAGATDGLVLEANITMATPGLYPGYGSYFSAANGKLYTGDDTIDLVYTYNDGTTTGWCTVYILYCELE